MQLPITRTPETPYPELEAVDGSLRPKSDPFSDESFSRKAARALGMNNKHAAAAVLSTLVEANFEPTAENCDLINGLTALVAEFAPRDPMEAMLAAQMVSAHNHLMQLLKKITKAGDMLDFDSPGHQAQVRLAERLMRTYARQMEALIKYRKKGEQRIIVERVHVEQGGQAIVGSNIQQGDKS
jgi:hypothetical protein